MRIRSCRICFNKRLTEILSLGDIPPVNYFPAAGAAHLDTPRYPLHLCLCQACGLAQLDETPPPARLFRDYHYLTSASAPLIGHFQNLARECTRRFALQEGDAVLDIGANDGTLLEAFRGKGARVLGMDPSRNAVESARAKDIPVLAGFFGARTAGRILRKYGRFRVITGTNVLAQNHDLHGFIKGVKMLLAPGGVFVAEFAHLLDMVMKNQFDVIYHEHLSFFSLPPLMRLFRANGLEIFDVKKILTQGGSLRVYARHAGQRPVKPSSAVRAILREETENDIHGAASLLAFARQVRRFRADMRSLVSGIKRQKKRIVGIGAPAKGVVLLHYCGLDHTRIDYIVDATPLKQGRLFPGTRIPVYPEEKLREHAQDYFLLLAWNFQDFLLKKLAPYRAAGVKIIVPFPKLRVLA